ncbi:MAG: FAD-dependent oxidoreductase, partial [Hyphomicrobiaceae bacterium]
MTLHSSIQPIWFEQALARETDYKQTALVGDIACDVCIIGGGYTGLWTALMLQEQQRDLDIVVIEKSLCGSGASGRNGGCMLTWSTKFIALKRLFGEAEACRLVKASEQALFHIRDFCGANGIDAEVRLDGVLQTATNSAQIGALDAVIEQLSACGLNNWQSWDRAQASKGGGSKRHLAGYQSPIGGSLQPGFLVRGLRRVALARNIRVFENTPMQSLEHVSSPRVITADGSVSSRKVVLALNAWMPTLFPSLARTVMLISSDMVITPPAAEQVADIGLVDGQAVVDSRSFVIYYRTTPDGRLMLGKGGNFFAFGNRVHPMFDQSSGIEARLSATVSNFFPALSSLGIERSWTGPSDRSATGLPFFGHLNGNSDIVFGFGYSGNGVGQSYVGAQFLTALVLEQDNEWTRSGMARGPIGAFPPEPLRWIGANIVKGAINRKERAEDRNELPTLIDHRLASLATHI